MSVSTARDPLTLLVGDCRETLRTLPDESVQCCVTSPPYWGLRDYGTGTWEGGDEGCDHVIGEMRRGVNLAASAANTRGGAKKCAEVEDIKAKAKCHKCGARRVDRQIGLEQTPEAFVATMVEVFREVRRVLKKDGTCWVNLGDSYNAAGRSGHGSRENCKQGSNRASAQRVDQCRPSDFSLKPKDLVGIPWRVAFALQADGWYLRQDIIWHKPNPMPESVRDRCTKAHEYLFLLSKSERYYWDQEAILEPVSPNTHARLSQNVAAQVGSTRANGGNSAKSNGNMKAVGRGTGSWNGSQFHTGKTMGHQGNRASTNRKTAEPGSGIKNNSSMDEALSIMPEVRNKRSVWTVPTFAFSDAHFATYPPDLIKPCILAGTRAGDVVLDPFGGSGTTGQVALELGRQAILCELNPEYAALIRQRTHVTPGLGL